LPNQAAGAIYIKTVEPNPPPRQWCEMAKVEIYTTMICPYCVRAKRLLEQRNAAFEEIDVMADGKRRAEMVTRAGGRTSVPQIFINGRHIGGSDDLYALDRQGGLAPLLAEPAP
jgi:glutaredoxin 3